jgi:hypothetical protein
VLAGLGLTIAPLMIHWLDRLAYALGFDYPPALLLMLAIIGLLLIIFQLSLNISHQSEHLKTLTQELGLLRQEVETLKQRVPPVPRAFPAPGLEQERTPHLADRGETAGQAAVEERGI